MLHPPTNKEPWIGQIKEGSRAEIIDFLVRAAKEIRIRDLKLVHSKKAGHIGGEMSAADILSTLLLHVMNFTPDKIDDPDRDRLVVSKGHIAAIFYTTLAAGGFIDPAELDTFLEPLSLLNGHPSSTKVAAVEADTGPLGHGLPIATGMAIAGQLDSSSRMIYCLLGDGELQEGSNWEAIMLAGNRHLNNLVAIVDRNRLQQGARVADTNDLEPLADKLVAFGWQVLEVDGHDIAQLLDAFASAKNTATKPTFVIANTHKGHPISFMSDNVAWHHKVPSEEEFNQALAELESINA